MEAALLRVVRVPLQVAALMVGTDAKDIIDGAYELNGQFVTQTRGIMAGPIAGAVVASSGLVRTTMDHIFAGMGVNPTTDAEVAAAMIFLTVGWTLLGYYFIAGGRHQQDRNALRRELRRVQGEMRGLQELLDAEEFQALVASRNGKEVRVFVEGAFDMMHYGHANAFRQARALGTYLVAGVNSSDSVEQCKGAPPVMTDDERLAVVASCKWVDEVIPRTPYVMTPEYLDWVIETYKIDFVVHGDDECLTPDGQDVYGFVKQRGMFRTVPRTEGVSTTEIVGRMLLLSTSHHLKTGEQTPGTPNGSLATKGGRHFGERFSSRNEGDGDVVSDSDGEGNSLSHYGPYRSSRFLTTSRMLRLFSQPPPRPLEGAKRVVYVCGGFDMFHAGHAAILKEARALGDYLLVGVYNDGICNHYRGGSHPILNLNERVLSVLACKDVDDVLLDPPLAITHEMIAALHISVVVTGTTAEFTTKPGGRVEDVDPVYAVAQELGMLKVVSSGSTLAMSSILTRIRASAARLEAKVAKKMAAEADHYRQKHGLSNYETGHGQR